jgi:hypothetical protein
MLDRMTTRCSCTVPQVVRCSRSAKRTASRSRSRTCPSGWPAARSCPPHPASRAPPAGPTAPPGCAPARKRDSRSGRYRLPARASYRPGPAAATAGEPRHTRWDGLQAPDDRGLPGTWVPISLRRETRESGSVAADLSASDAVGSGWGSGSHWTSDVVPATRVGREPSSR